MYSHARSTSLGGGHFFKSPTRAEQSRHILLTCKHTTQLVTFGSDIVHRHDFIPLWGLRLTGTTTRVQCEVNILVKVTKEGNLICELNGFCPLPAKHYTAHGRVVYLCYFFFLSFPYHFLLTLELINYWIDKVFKNILQITTDWKS